MLSINNMNKQFLHKLNDLTDTFDRNPCDPYKKEFVEGEYAWLIRKRILDGTFVEYYVSRVSLTEQWKRNSAFITPSTEGDWSIEVVS